MRVPRWALVAVSFLALVGLSVGVAAVVSGGNATTKTATPGIVSETQNDAHLPSADEMTSKAAVGAKQASIKLAAELATPETIANTFFFTQSIEDVKP
jgi:hypothetical protein